MKTKLKNQQQQQQEQRRKRKQNPFRMVCKCSWSMLKVVARRTHTRPPRIVYAVSVQLWPKAHTTRRTRSDHVHIKIGIFARRCAVVIATVSPGRCVSARRADFS